MDTEVTPRRPLNRHPTKNLEPTEPTACFNLEANAMTSKRLITTICSAICIICPLSSALLWLSSLQKNWQTPRPSFFLQRRLRMVKVFLVFFILFFFGAKCQVVISCDVSCQFGCQNNAICSWLLILSCFFPSSLLSRIARGIDFCSDFSALPTRLPSSYNAGSPDTWCAWAVTVFQSL